MEVRALLDVLHIAERLKDELRHCETSRGRRESVAEHSWRIALMALFMQDEFPELDINKVIRMCLIHDLGECFTGDIPTFLKSASDEKKEDTALFDWVASLPAPYNMELAALYTEMGALQTDEAKLYKALDKLEADRSTLRTGMDTAQRKLKQAEQTVAAAEAAVEALTAQQTAAQKELPARSAEELTAQQTELTAARETLRSREKQLSAQLLPNRKTAAQYRAAAEARQTLESRWQWVSALAATAGGTLTSKQKIKLEAYIQMNYLDRILRYANTRLMQMTAGQYELERIGAENQRSQSGLDLGVIDHYNGTRRSVKTLSGGESFKASLALALGLSDEVQSSAGGIRLDTLFLDEGFGSLDEESLELAIRVLSGLTEGDRLVGIISHVGALKDRIDRQVVVHKARTGGSTVELRV